MRKSHQPDEGATVIEFNPTPLLSQLEEAVAAGPVPLRDVDPSVRAGAYLVFHTETDDRLYPRSLTRPVYAGRARRLSERVRAHRKSLAQARNLDIASFGVVQLETRSRAVAAMIEELAIQRWNPVWNQTTVSGFGSRNRGAGRSGEVPGWDRLHPGRIWVANRQDPPCPILEQWVREFLERPVGDECRGGGGRHRAGHDDNSNQLHLPSLVGS